MRLKREHGRILSVETKNRGGSLAVDAVAGATEITVDDAGDFDEDGGWLYIGAQTVAYTACDDDTGVITLADPLTDPAEQGDEVALWSDLYAEVVDYQEALVELDGEYDNPDPVIAEVAEGVGELPEGDRGKAGESCTLLRVADDEWEVVGVDGRPKSASGVLFWQDTYTVTATGAQSIPLTFEPIENSEHVYWRPGGLAGIYLGGSEWSRSGQTLTAADPDSLWAAGDKFTIEYAYRKGVTTPSAIGEPQYVGVTMITGPTTSVALPAGTQAGDLLILAETDWTSATCTDPRMTLHDTFPGQFKSLGNAWVGTADGSGSPVAVNFAGTAGRVSGALVALRSAQLAASPAPLTAVAPSATASGAAPQASAATFTVAIALLRNGALSTGLIGHSAGGYTVVGFDNTSLKTCCVVAYWNSSSPTTSPADTFTFSGSIDAWALATYKIAGA